jgi:putative ABC transport system substrate-binding protein
MVLRLLRSLLTALVLGQLAFGLAAQPRGGDARVVMVSSDSTAAYMEATQALISELGNNGVSPSDIRRLSLSDWTAAAVKPASSKLYVALGTQATAALAVTPLLAPVLAVLVPRASFEGVLAGGGRKASSNFTAIYLDQPLARQLALVRLALPKARRIGVLWGPDSWGKAPTFRTAAQANGFSVNEVGLDGRFNVFPDLQQVLNGSDVFFALADPMVFNSNSIQNILLTTFRAQVPLVAFSPAYVRAGALFALHTTPEQAGKQAAAQVLEALRGQLLPERPVEPNDFEVAVNDHVARVFGLSLDARALRQALRRAENLP